MPQTFTLTLTCAQRPGIVHAVSSFLLQHNCDISEHKQFDDTENGAFFLRTSFVPTDEVDTETLTCRFYATAAEFGMNFEFTSDEDRAHHRDGVAHGPLPQRPHLSLACRQSRRRDRRCRVKPSQPSSDGRGGGPALPSHSCHANDQTAGGKRTARARRALPRRSCGVGSLHAGAHDLSTCRELYGRAINIHHSFLPGFKGAKPYHQAFDRGVELVGATAHYVTAELDEGPIIEQVVIRIDHSYDPARLVTVGRDAEALALSRAVRWHCEHRILLYDHRTVVLR